MLKYEHMYKSQTEVAMKTMHKEPCYCCGKKTANPYQAFCEDDNGQEQLVGRDCYKQIKAANSEGWQPPRGGPRMFSSREAAIKWSQQ